MKIQALFVTAAAIALGSVAVASAPAHAGNEISTNYSNQVQLIVNPAAARVEARGAAVSMSGSGLSAITTLPSIAAGVATPGVATLDPLSAGESFTYAQSANNADLVNTGTVLSSSITTPGFSVQELTNGGVASDILTGASLTGTIDSPNNGRVTAGGAGTAGILTQSASLSVFR